MDEENQKSFAETVRDAVNNFEEIVRSEFRLAKLEMREAALKATLPAQLLLAGAALAMYALGFLLLTMLFALRIALPAWLSALIVFIVAAIFAAALVGSGIRKLRQLKPPLERTTANLKEQVQWAKQQAR